MYINIGREGAVLNLAYIVATGGSSRKTRFSQIMAGTIDCSDLKYETLEMKFDSIRKACQTFSNVQERYVQFRNCLRECSPSSLCGFVGF